MLAGGFLSIIIVNSEGEILQVLLLATVTVMFGAILVPFRRGRTFAISALGFLLAVVACIAGHSAVVLLLGSSATYQNAVP